MRSNRPQGAANNPRGHRFGAGVVRVLSVTAVAATACAMMAGAASAGTRHATTTHVSVSPKRALVGETVRLSATVKSATRPRGRVLFTWNGVRLCSARLHHGSAACNTKFFKARNYWVRGTYLGNAAHKPSTNIARVHVVAPPPPVKHATTTTITNAIPGAVDVGKTFTFDVTVTSAGGSAATGKVVVKPTTALPAAYSCTATVTGGKGTCKVTPPEYGIVEYTATYGGDATHKGSTYAGPFALEVKNVTTTTITVTSATAGAVTLTADIDAMGANITDGEGSVAFYVGTSATTLAAVPECAAVPLTTFTAPNNVATCTGSATLNALKAGTYTISAVYSGDVVNEVSTSANGSLVIP
jgi:hypothetical protein